MKDDAVKSVGNLQWDRYFPRPLSSWVCIGHSWHGPERGAVCRYLYFMFIFIDPVFPEQNIPLPLWINYWVCSARISAAASMLGVGSRPHLPAASWAHMLLNSTTSPWLGHSMAMLIDVFANYPTWPCIPRGWALKTWKDVSMHFQSLMHLLHHCDMLVSSIGCKPLPPILNTMTIRRCLRTLVRFVYKCREAPNILSLQLHFFSTIISKPVKF